MCDANGPFKLCTCSASVDRTKPHWILYRSGDEDDFGGIIGQFNEPSLIHPLVVRKIIRKLNQNNLFDFKYTPENGDLLILFDGRDAYYLRFKDSKWKSIDESLFKGLKDENRKHRMGILTGPKSELRNLIEKIEGSGEFSFSEPWCTDRFLTWNVYNKVKKEKRLSERRLIEILHEEVQRLGLD